MTTPKWYAKEKRQHEYRCWVLGTCPDCGGVESVAPQDDWPQPTEERDCD